MFIVLTSLTTLKASIQVLTTDIKKEQTSKHRELSGHFTGQSCTQGRLSASAPSVSDHKEEFFSAYKTFANSY